MKKHLKSVKAAALFVFSFVLFFATTVFASASEAAEPLIKFDVDPGPIIATVALVFGLLIALILALVFLIRHISETKRRITRLSKIRSEDTVQLYDDLNEEKWNSDEDEAEKPRDVRIEDDYAKKSSVKPRAAKAPLPEKEDEPHGPVPERDMPGYDPNANNEDNELKPVSPFAPAPNASSAQYAAAPMTQPSYQSAPEQVGAMQTPVAASPLVYRPDPDVEIIMRDDLSAAKGDGSVNVVCNLNPEHSSETVSAITSEASSAPHRVRAVRRRGKVPGLVTRATLDPAVAMQRSLASSGAGGRPPRLNINSLSITPKINTAPVGYASDAPTPSDEDYILKLRGLPVEEEVAVSEAEPSREAPIVDVSEPIDQTADAFGDITVRLEPPLAPADGAAVRTLDDVLDELESSSDDEDITELEAIDKPVREEELVFLGSGSVTDDVDSDDDIFTDEDGEARMFLNGKYTLVRYKTSFLARFIQSEEKIQDYYSVLKNVLMSYKGIESSLGWSSETFTHNGELCAKINVADKMVLLYLALDPERYHNYKYHYTYAYTKYKSTKVPMFVKIKSDRALKYALELIVALMNDLALESGEMPDIDYRRPYETVPALIDRGLIKIVVPKNGAEDSDEQFSELNTSEIVEKLSALDNSEQRDVSEGLVFDFDEAETIAPMVITVDNAPTVIVENPIATTSAEPETPVADPSVEAEEPHQPVMHVDAKAADLLLSDAEAIASIELVEDAEHEAGVGKLCEVNLDTICAVFNDGEVVNLKTLKAKRLVSQNAGRIKVLARGTMTKTLTVYADRFSLQAVKMITLAGGHAEQYK